MKSLSQRLNNVIGQLEGIRRMAESGTDCFETLIQMKAARSAFNAMVREFASENFIDCIDRSCDNRDRDKMKRLVKELVES